MSNLFGSSTEHISSPKVPFTNTTAAREKGPAPLASASTSTEPQASSVASSSSSKTSPYFSPWSSGSSLTGGSSGSFSPSGNGCGSNATTALSSSMLAASGDFSSGSAERTKYDGLSGQSFGMNNDEEDRSKQEENLGNQSGDDTECSTSEKVSERRRSSDTTQIALEGLSVVEGSASDSSLTAEQASSPKESKGVPHHDSYLKETDDIPPEGKLTKTRRASTLSSSSSNAAYGAASLSGSVTAGGSTAAEEIANIWAKGEREGKPARRKAARMGSFRKNSASSGGSSGESESAILVNEDHLKPHPPNPDGVSQTGLNGKGNSHPIASPSEEELPPQQLPPTGVKEAPLPENTSTSGISSPRRTSRASHHVDIVNYPSGDLLKLLASLLEQIAHANDALHQRSASGSGSNTPGGALVHGQDDNDETNSFFQGRFDAAPLNSPVTPRYRRGSSHPQQGQSSRRGSGAYFDSEEIDVDEDMDKDEIPVTPGVDLLREVGERGGVEGFMPSLGGTHSPMPLARRRGSSFLNKALSAVVTGSPEEGKHTPDRRSSTGQPTGSPVGKVPSSSAFGSEPPLSSLLSASSVALSSPSATLCFHARNIPAITIEAYLLRILKYCPTTNEVFLSLLVYFDRMARVGLEAQRVGLVQNKNGETTGMSRSGSRDGDVSRMFAIDSFNVHRLVIAGVTVASKFFSDVFYTNSRYAKVGGLPLNELNQLELQFLLLNDFRLVIPVDELQRYADQLVLYWVGRSGSHSLSHPATSGLSSGAQTPARSSSTSIKVEDSDRTKTPSAVSGYAGVATPRHAHNTSNVVSQRPSSIRSQPSSSGTSVTSTITPGTPSTSRQSDGSERDSDDYGGDRDEDDGADENAEYSTGPHVHMMEQD